ncbi:MAG: hypothetical protein Q7V62_15145, partial [Actinomycetota bacterium]|nr:hypothetical protein [Actinomycetota bacterium]
SGQAYGFVVVTPPSSVLPLVLPAPLPVLPAASSAELQAATPTSNNPTTSTLVIAAILRRAW